MYLKAIMAAGHRSFHPYPSIRTLGDRSFRRNYNLAKPFRRRYHWWQEGALGRRPVSPVLGAVGEEGASSTTILPEDAGRRDAGGGTVLGAASLIIGTSIGTGILALPKETSPAGFVPSTVSIVACWAFLVVEALLLAEINVSLTQRKREREREKEGEEEEEIPSSSSSSFPTMSFKTMAQETLGELGASLATITYVFLGYTSMTAYASESGELLSHFIALPPSSLSIFFTATLASLIFLGGTRTADHVNQWLTALMLGLLVILEATAASSGDWIGLMAREDWGKVPRAVPVIIFSLVFHDIVPVICSYLECDGKRIRSSILIGSLIPLLFLLAWDGVVLSSSTQIEGIDPLELLFRGSNVAESTMAETFSILAVATSLIGTLLGFSSFFQEQFYSLLLRGNNTDLHTSTQEGHGSRADGSNRREQQPVMGEMSMADLSAFAVAVIPPIIIATSLADAFSLATDIAGGYCMIVLYGVLPPAMAWSLKLQQSGISLEDHENTCKSYGNLTKNEETAKKVVLGYEVKGKLLETKPALIGVGLLAMVLVAEQLFQDVPFLLNNLNL